MIYCTIVQNIEEGSEHYTIYMVNTISLRKEAMQVPLVS